MKGEKMDSDSNRTFDISEEDIYEAMKEIEGYLDITPGDFRALYAIAHRHAITRLATSVKAGDVMTRDVVFVEKGTPLAEVADRMAREGVSGVPVIQDQKVVGVISEKDFVFAMGGEALRSFMAVVAHCLGNKGCAALPMRHQAAEHIMTQPALTVSMETPLSKVANIMAENNLNRVPVVDSEGKLLGIIARADIVQTSCTVIIPSEGMRPSSEGVA
ncbi:CBS domain protein [delta proteobacterium NaphS2]|nr:CBS domain protein [delta proteobacterium NaphS2]